MLRQLLTSLEPGSPQSAAPRLLRMPKPCVALIALCMMAGIVVAQDRAPVTSGVPTFRVDPAWPSIPNNWQFGQAVGFVPGLAYLACLAYEGAQPCS
ncbi:MAG: hypothetical protein K1X67_24275 [Fimbriimonadaceae bacterium]|nr:hypothetical protein [Fimbriimonadaceae bacterium]